MGFLTPCENINNDETNKVIRKPTGYVIIFPGVSGEREPLGDVVGLYLALGKKVYICDYSLLYENFDIMVDGFNVGATTFESLAKLIHLEFQKKIPSEDPTTITWVGYSLGARFLPWLAKYSPNSSLVVIDHSYATLSNSDRNIKTVEILQKILSSENCAINDGVFTNLLKSPNEEYNTNLISVMRELLKIADEQITHIKKALYETLSCVVINLLVESTSESAPCKNNMLVAVTTETIQGPYSAEPNLGWHVSAILIELKPSHNEPLMNHFNMLRSEALMTALTIFDKDVLMRSVATFSPSTSAAEFETPKSSPVLGPQKTPLASGAGSSSSQPSSPQTQSQKAAKGACITPPQARPLSKRRGDLAPRIANRQRLTSSAKERYFFEANNDPQDDQQEGVSLFAQKKPK